MYYNFIYPDIRINPDYRFDEVMSGYNYNFSIVNNWQYSGATIGGVMLSGGSITPQAWTVGQVIKDTMLSNTEVTVSTTTIGTSGSDTDFVTYSYTPVSSNSYLIIHYHLASYDFTSGTGNDSYFSRIKVDGGKSHLEHKIRLMDFVQVFYSH